MSPGNSICPKLMAFFVAVMWMHFFGEIQAIIGLWKFDLASSRACVVASMRPLPQGSSIKYFFQITSASTRIFFFNWGHVCVGCSDRGSFANPHLENFNSWYDPLHMIGGLRGIPQPAVVPYL